MQVIVKFNRGIPELSEDLRNAYRTFGNDQALITIEKLPMSHSKAQQAYFNGIVVKAFQSLWRDSIGYMHEKIVKGHLKAEFLKKEHICEESGEVLEYILNTSDLSVSEYDLLIQQCRMLYQHQSGEILPYTPYYRGKERG